MGIKSFMRTACALAAIGIFGSAAWAQTTYAPIQYQFGRSGEIFYGGLNPYFRYNPYQFAPEVPANGQADSSGYVNGLPSPYPPAIDALTQSMGWNNAANHPSIYHTQSNNVHPQIFTDLEPGVDVSGRGFTINDARNEAYFNAPRTFSKAQMHAEMHGGMPPEEAAPQPVMEPVGRPMGIAPADKAKMLLDWAKSASAKPKNAELVKQLIKEAEKYDPAAAAKARNEIKPAAQAPAAAPAAAPRVATT